MWTVPAVIAPTQQWVQLQDTPKHMGWLAAFLYQAPSWYALVPLTPLVILATRRWPIRGEHLRRRLLIHALASVLFGAVFVAVSVPLRTIFHPAPVQWDLFGPPFYKSAPQFALVGIAAYWALVLVGTLIETSQRAASLSVELQDRNGVERAERLVIETPAGRAMLAPMEIRWCEPDGRATLLRTDGEPVRTRHTMSELESMLVPLGFARVHRSRLVNIARVREVSGSASRDGTLVLDSGDRLPVSRRRREELDTLLSG